VTSINLTIARSAFATIDEEKSDYIKGTVAVNGMTEDEYPYVWVSSNGWIVAYIPRDYKSEALIAPFGYNYRTTTLAEAIKTLTTIKLVITTSSSDANGVVVALESVSSPVYRYGSATDEFWVNISKDTTIYNISWVYYSNYEDNRAALDGKTFVEGSASPHKKWGFFSESKFVKGVDHRVEVYARSDYYAHSKCAKIAIVMTST